jgi:HCOMODA/2-hydroxy-3-carboxy-muconic semialdehyde decarboxylase
MSDLAGLQQDLVTANHILAREGVTDALGHISVRHPDRPGRFFLSCSRSPELVTLDDIMEYDLDCNPVDPRGRPMYFERPIHGAIYQARPTSSPSCTITPTGYSIRLTRRPLKACVHPAAASVRMSPCGTAAPPSRYRPLDHEHGAGGLARGMGQHNSVLLRGHGCVVVEAISAGRAQCRILKINASLVLQSMLIGDDMRFERGRDRADQEARLCGEFRDPDVGLLVAPMRRPA